MSPRASRWVLWIGLVLMLPLPMLVFGALIPVARFLLLAGVTAGLIVAEGMGTIPGSILGLLLLHALVYLGLTWLAAHWISRGLGRLAPRALGPVTLGLVAAGLILSSLFDVYVTPFAPVSPRASLLHILE
jgi:hypothetical protein